MNTKEAKPTHTPGPWTVSNGSDGKHIGIRYAGPGIPVLLADMVNHLASNGIPQEANARLIAAAPDLLAALQQFAAVFEHTDIRDMNTPTYQALDNARAAILRATTGGK